MFWGRSIGSLAPLPYLLTSHLPPSTPTSALPTDHPLLLLLIAQNPDDLASTPGLDYGATPSTGASARLGPSSLGPITPSTPLDKYTRPQHGAAKQTQQQQSPLALGKSRSRHHTSPPGRTGLATSSLPVEVRESDDDDDDGEVEEVDYGVRHLRLSAEEHSTSVKKIKNKTVVGGREEIKRPFSHPSTQLDTLC